MIEATRVACSLAPGLVSSSAVYNSSGSGSDHQKRTSPNLDVNGGECKTVNRDMKFPWKVRTIGLLGLDEMIKGETRYGAQNTMPFVYGRARNVRGQEAAFVRVKPHIVCV